MTCSLGGCLSVRCEAAPTDVDGCRQKRVSHEVDYRLFVCCQDKRGELVGRAEPYVMRLTCVALASLPSLPGGQATSISTS